MKSKLEKFTIAIPTFERCEAVVECLEDILGQDGGENISILVSDNASSDSSWDSLQKFSDVENIQLVRNDENLGYQGNFMQLFQLVKTEYIVILSDEDQVDINALDEISDYIDGHGSTGLISPRMKIGSECYRGKTKIKDIELKDFLKCTFYISGLIYHVPTVNSTIKKIGRDEFFLLGQVYPQCLLAAGILASGSHSVWYPKTLVTKVHQLATRINEDTKGASYHSLEGRSTQFRLFEETFSKMKNRDDLESSERSRWVKLREAWMTGALGYLRLGFANSYGDDVSFLDKSMKRFLLPARFVSRLGRGFTKALNRSFDK